MRAETISVGTELLLGEITDTNATHISQRFADIGVDLHYRHTVGDNLARLVEVLQLAMGRSDVVLLSGGLGPTADDITRDAIARVTARPLRRDAAAVEHLKAFFHERGRIPTESNFKQCDVPEGGRLIENTCGTAPGIFSEHDDTLIFAVPGPPSEMREMLRLSVIPVLVERGSRDGGRLYSRALRLADIGESNVATMLADTIDGQTDPTIALYASPGEVKVRLATKDPSETAALQRLDALEAVVRQRLGEHVYGTDEETMEVAVGKALQERGATLAVAESCTGGLVASRVTDVPGSSGYFLGSVVAYSNEAKADLLGVPEQVIREHGAVSEECARTMAQGARRRFGADWAVSTTGIAGPGGGSPDKPVGLVYIAVAGPDGASCDRQSWPGTRDQFKQRVSQMALNMLRKRILAGGE